MAQIEGVPAAKAGLFGRLAYFLTRRRLGRVITPIKILAHMELGQEAARGVGTQLKTLAHVKVAMMVDCPF